jgi:hypothetical protein
MEKVDLIISIKLYCVKLFSRPRIKQDIKAESRMVKIKETKNIFFLLAHALILISE